MTTHNLTAASGTGTGAEKQIAGGMLDNATLHVYGGSTQTFSIEVSPDGTNWVTAKDTNGVALTGLIAGGSWNLRSCCYAIRRNVTAYTSGTNQFILTMPGV